MATTRDLLDHELAKSFADLNKLQDELDGVLRNQRDLTPFSLRETHKIANQLLQWAELRNVMLPMRAGASVRPDQLTVGHGTVRLHLDVKSLHVLSDHATLNSDSTETPFEAKHGYANAPVFRPAQNQTHFTVFLDKASIGWRDVPLDFEPKSMMHAFQLQFGHLPTHYAVYDSAADVRKALRHALQNDYCALSETRNVWFTRPQLLPCDADAERMFRPHRRMVTELEREPNNPQLQAVHNIRAENPLPASKTDKTYMTFIQSTRLLSTYLPNYQSLRVTKATALDLALDVARALGRLLFPAETETNFMHAWMHNAVRGQAWFADGSAFWMSGQFSHRRHIRVSVHQDGELIAWQTRARYAAFLLAHADLTVKPRVKAEKEVGLAEVFEPGPLAEEREMERARTLLDFLAQAGLLLCRPADTPPFAYVYNAVSKTTNLFANVPDMRAAYPIAG